MDSTTWEAEDAPLTREQLIAKLRGVARLAEVAKQYAAARQAYRDVAELEGHLKAPERDPAQDVSPEERRRVICETAAALGMVWPEGAKR